MFEKHPYGDFIPSGSQFLLLGSFPGKPKEGNNWFYSSNRNQFWPILEAVYETTLDTKVQKQNLFNRLDMAITDIILSCKRENESNLDHNLSEIIYNTEEITRIVQENEIRKIFFTSRFVETNFKRKFEVSKNYSAAMSVEEKIKQYKKFLPQHRS